ncbi:unnamed protein product [Cuscuta epithymum]|uniref:Uncharacterized protein n=1 Tax=Cuscuta epithymum TaxID=186058 RepID=A0AAV0C6H8_9ASTE|nr:unnamed protein product [Cuscuta epithymum]
MAEKIHSISGSQLHIYNATSSRRSSRLRRCDGLRSPHEILTKIYISLAGIPLEEKVAQSEKAAPPNKAPAATTPDEADCYGRFSDVRPGVAAGFQLWWRLTASRVIELSALFWGSTPAHLCKTCALYYCFVLLWYCNTPYSLLIKKSVIH